jgi:hypothetical protein
MFPKQYFVNFLSGNLTKTSELPYFMFIFLVFGFIPNLQINLFTCKSLWYPVFMPDIEKGSLFSFGSLSQCDILAKLIVVSEVLKCKFFMICVPFGEILFQIHEPVKQPVRCAINCY